MSSYISVEGGLLKAIGGFTWPGIEYGEPPRYKYSFYQPSLMQYVDALRLGDIELFKEIEEESGDWWFATLDRGAGALLHFAAEHGQLHCVKFLVEQSKVAVNQLDLNRGWTPLMRVAHMAHHTTSPYMAVFEYLLQQGADPSIEGQATTLIGVDIPGEKATAVDVAVEKGRGWEPGQVKRKLQGLIDKYADVPKKPAYTYQGGPIGETAQRIYDLWLEQPPKVQPTNWRAPPEAGYMDAQGMRRESDEPWRPAGDNDGSFFTRKMTEQELREQSEMVAAM